MKRVSMRKISEVLRLHFKLGLSVRQSANATGTSRGSVGNYCARFKELEIDRTFWVEKNEVLLNKLESVLNVIKNGKIKHDAGKQGREYVGEQRK